MMQIQDRKPSFEAIAQPSLWSQSGSFFLLGAFAILICKCAPFFWPLLACAFIGCSISRVWKKQGLYFSFTLLLAVCIFIIRRGADPIWSSLFSASIALSWLLIFWGRQEADLYFEKSEANIAALKDSCNHLEESLRQALNSRLEENKASAAEKEHLNRLNAENAEIAQSLTQMQHSWEVSEREREKLDRKCQELSQSLFEYQSKEIAFQQALEDAQTQLLQLKNSDKAIVLEEENDPEEIIQLSQAQHQYALLREQFEEKSEILDKTRKELFCIENAFLALRKAQEESALDLSEEDLVLMKELMTLEEQCSYLEAQVLHLQEIVTALLAPKKRIVRPRRLKTYEKLPHLIQEKIDEVSQPEIRKV